MKRYKKPEKKKSLPDRIIDKFKNRGKKEGEPEKLSVCPYKISEWNNDKIFTDKRMPKAKCNYIKGLTKVCDGQDKCETFKELQRR